MVPERYARDVPPGRPGHEHSRAPRRLLGSIVSAASLVLALALGLFFLLGGPAERELELARLRAENRHLMQNLAEIEGRIEQLGAHVEGLSAMDERFRLLAGLPRLDPEIRAVGVGGPVAMGPAREEFLRAAPATAARSFAAAYDLDELLRRANLLEESLSEALDSVRIHREVFLARPSILPVQTEGAWISSAFSHSRYHPLLLYNRPHEGIDIAALAGSPILATANGRVTFAGTRPGYGKVIDIDHGFGYVTRYAHASRILVRPGQGVARGEMIGEVGQTGLASAPNVHYEVLIDGRPVNPRAFLLLDPAIPE